MIIRRKSYPFRLGFRTGAGIDWIKIGVVLPSKSSSVSVCHSSTGYSTLEEDADSVSEEELDGSGIFFLIRPEGALDPGLAN